jgi:hypothetical protein
MLLRKLGEPLANLVYVQAAFMLMLLRKLGEPLEILVHVQAAFMLMGLRKLGEPLANPCPCTGSVHADGAAEAWRAACKSLCPCTGSFHADGPAKAWHAACANPYVHVQAAFMLMLLRKLGKPLANPFPCTGSVHADGAAEAWRAARKSLSMYRQRSC